MTLITVPEPPRGGYRGRPGWSSPLTLWLNELRSTPGTCARFPEPRSLADGYLIRSGKAYGAVRGEFEVATRTTNELGEKAPAKQTWIYATYNPKKDTP